MRTFVFISIFIFFFNNLYSQTIVLQENKPSQEVGIFLTYLEDKSGKLTIEEIAKPESEKLFKPNLQKVFNVGVSSSTFWIKLNVQNISPQVRDWLLYSSYTFLDEITLYKKDIQKGWTNVSIGLQHNFTNRPVKHRYLVFPLTFQDAQVQIFYLKIKSETPIQLPLYIERGSSFAEPSRTLELFYGVFIGITGLMFLGSIFFFVYFKDKEYLYYSIFLTGAITFYLSLSGHFFQHIWRENGQTGKIFLGFAMGIWVIGAGLFTKNFLQTFRYFPLATSLMNIYAIFGVWVCCSVFFFSYPFFSIQIIIIGNLGNLVITIIGIVCWIRGNPFAKYFAIAWIFYVTGTILLALSVTGLLPRTFITAHLGEISCVFEVIMFALALSYKNRMKHEKVRQDRLKSQQKVIELQKDNNTRLERQVAERTKTLQQKQEEIEFQNKELKQQQEELEISRNQLAEQNKIIEQQNLDLKAYNENLEVLVNQRTQQLTDANLELVNQNMQLEQFTFITAHNLRSPVAQLLGLTRLFNNQDITDPLNQEILKHIVTSTHSMHQTLQDLSEILDVRKGKNQNLEHLSFPIIATEVIKDYFDKLADVQIHLHFNQADSIYFGKAYLKSIFYNFISNAIKYKHPQRNPIIEIYTKDYPHEVCLTFKDNGMGIDLKKYMHKLFGLYQRFHLEKEGKGMGLYLCKTQIEALGGRIQVQSEVNIGTQFDIYFKKIE
ncbi:MAG: ATP-binding protein [Raineya sp.]|jgi:signal transduction histidine kinase|nr:ATP-binding protein [Raineya sp.]